MTSAPYQTLLETVIDLAVQLEVGADDRGVPPETCVDSLERLYSAFDELPQDSRTEVLGMVTRLSRDERRGPNRADRLAALEGIRASLSGR